MAGRDDSSMVDDVVQQLKESAETKLQIASEAQIIVKIAQVWARALQGGNKLLFCGNGGSAADSQHLAAELVGRFEKERRALPAIALTTDTSILTAIANDYGYQEVFSRQVSACGREGDVLVGISTSGQSSNIIRAMEQAKELGIISVAFTGSKGQLRELADYAVCVPNSRTARIQESHITIGHIICGLVDDLMSPCETAERI